MKTQINNLKKVQNKIVDLTEKRDKVALMRSDEWYNSEKGKKHELATATLADAVETVKSAIKELETYLNQA